MAALGDANFCTLYFRVRSYIRLEYGVWGGVTRHGVEKRSKESWHVGLYVRVAGCSTCHLKVTRGEVESIKGGGGGVGFPFSTEHGVVSVLSTWTSNVLHCVAREDVLIWRFVYVDVAL